MHMLSSQSCAQPEAHTQTQTHSHTFPRSPLESKRTVMLRVRAIISAELMCVCVSLLQVTYDLTGSLDKNKDVLPQNILFVMKSKDWEFCVLVITSIWSKKLTMVTVAPIKTA